MKIHSISTGYVKITQNWQQGAQRLRLVQTLLDRRYTDWLPINVYVIEHPEGLVVIDTGIADSANDPVYFPPYMRLIQRAAYFQITREQEIDVQMRARGLNPQDVRYVIMTHLHQDHDGGLRHFPNADFLVSRAEWDAAQGLKGRLAGYLNHKWPDGFTPRIISYDNGKLSAFDRHYQVFDDLWIVPTPGHSAGHQSVILEDGQYHIMFAGDAAYNETLLHAGKIDGVTGDDDAYYDSNARIKAYCQQNPTVFLPSHDLQASVRLEKRQTVAFEKSMLVS